MTADAAPVPLSFLLRESQYEVAQAIQRWFTGLVNVPGTLPPGHMARGIESYNPPDNPHNTPWSPEFQVFQAQDGRWFRCIFQHQGWDPGESGYVYSKPTVLSAGLEVLSDHSYLFDNSSGVEPLDIDLEEEVTYAHTRETTTSRTIHFDFGAKLGATIGGKESGGSIEAEVSAAFGFSDTDTDVKGESTSQTRKQAIRTKVPPGSAVLATVSSPTVTERRTFDINAVWLSSLRLGVWGGDGPGGAYPGGYEKWGYVKNMLGQSRVTRGITIPDSDDTLTEISFPSMDDFVEMLQGTNVYFPAVRDLPPPYLDFGGIADAINGRRVVAQGVETVTEQHAAAYRFEAVQDVATALAGVRDDHYITAT